VEILLEHYPLGASNLTAKNYCETFHGGSSVEITALRHWK